MNVSRPKPPRPSTSFPVKEPPPRFCRFFPADARASSSSSPSFSSASRPGSPSIPEARTLPNSRATKTPDAFVPSPTLESVSVRASTAAAPSASASFPGNVENPSVSPSAPGRAFAEASAAFAGASWRSSNHGQQSSTSHVIATVSFTTNPFSGSIN